MQSSKDGKGRAHREYSQLLRLLERVLTQIQRVAEDLTAPGSQALVREVKRRTGESDENMANVTSAVEEAIRILKVWESEIRLALITDADAIEVDGVPNLPPSLARFLAERKQVPGFSFEVTQDEVRGWVIRWKEFTSSGTVRGCGQFYERPYAWLDD
jgi:hypothetical protein